MNQTVAIDAAVTEMETKVAIETTEIVEPTVHDQENVEDLKMDPEIVRDHRIDVRDREAEAVVVTEEMGEGDMMTGTEEEMTMTEIAEVGFLCMVYNEIILIKTGKPRDDRDDRRSRSPPTNLDLPTRTRPDPKIINTMSFAMNNQSPRQSKLPVKDEESDVEVEVEQDDDMAAMQAMMGFGGFDTTKNKKVAGNNASAVRKEKKVEYRQYMNRQGGFNRPLSPSR